MVFFKKFESFLCPKREKRTKQEKFEAKKTTTQRAAVLATNKQ
jgi:hypothetical protein